MIKILFVCHGNICRSPMAEFVLKDMVKQRGLESRYEIASAATSREEIGNPVYPPAKRKLAERGIGCSEAFQHHETLEEQLPTQEEMAQNKEKFSAYTGKIRKPGTGGIYELNDHLYEGRYSPTNAQGKREVYTVYAKTKEECETLLEQMIAEVKAKIAAEKELLKAEQSLSEA